MAIDKALALINGAPQVVPAADSLDVGSGIAPRVPGSGISFNGETLINGVVNIIGSGTTATTYRGGTIVSNATSKGSSFTVDGTISRYYLTADGLTITLDDTLPDGSTWELWHDTTTVNPAHVLSPTSGTVAQLPNTAPAPTLTWPTGQGVMTITKKSSGVWLVS